MCSTIFLFGLLSVLQYAVAADQTSVNEISIPFDPLRTDPGNTKSVVCPGGSSACPDGYTCCKLSTGQYGCCPYPNAVCCSDEEHCCPQGYTCNVAGGTCQRRDEVPWRKKTNSLLISNEPIQSNSVVCPGGSSACPDGYTCCKLSTGQYGCCPYPNAVCCSDEEHCCPQGYTCNVAGGTCQRRDEVPWRKKTNSLLISNEPIQSNSVVCPGGSSACPDGYTCCKLSTGQYGCCPYPNAVCCSDEEHCCPQGYTCNVAGGTCQRRDEVPWRKKTNSLLISNEPIQSNSVVCPGGSSACPDGYTCCKLSTGQYGCCPYPNAVCCRDGQHCCPGGYQCNVTAGTCVRSSDSIETGTLIELASSSEIPCRFGSKCTICPDGSECPSYNTCCQMSDGNYGCCKYSMAVCCSDRQHCCPHSTACDMDRHVCASQWSQPLAALQTDSKLIKKLVFIPQQDDDAGVVNEL